PAPLLSACPGTEDYAPGPVRVSFLLIDNQGAPVYRPTARVSVATSARSKPFVRTTASLEPIGVPGESQAAAGDITKLFVAHFKVPRPGKYTLVAEPVGGKPRRAIWTIVVRAQPRAPAV